MLEGGDSADGGGGIPAHVQAQLDAFERVVVAEEARADRAHAAEVENLRLIVAAAEQAGSSEGDLEEARQLLQKLLGDGGTEEEVESLHTGGLQTVDLATSSVALGVGDAFELLLPSDPQTGFIMELQEEGMDRAVLAVARSQSAADAATGRVDIHWKAVARALGCTSFTVNFGVPWEGMHPLLELRVEVIDAMPLGERAVEASSMLMASAGSAQKGSAAAGAAGLPAPPGKPRHPGAQSRGAQERLMSAAADEAADEAEAAAAVAGLAAAKAAAVELQTAAAEVRAAMAAEAADATDDDDATEAGVTGVSSSAADGLPPAVLLAAPVVVDGSSGLPVHTTTRRGDGANTLSAHDGAGADAGDDDGDRSIEAWLRSHRLHKYVGVVLEQGYEEVQFMRDADESDIDALIEVLRQEAGMKAPAAKTLRKAWQALSLGGGVVGGGGGEARR